MSASSSVARYRVFRQTCGLRAGRLSQKQRKSQQGQGKDENDSDSHKQRVAGLAETTLEAQQRDFSYRAILVAIVSQNSFVLVFVGVSRNYRAIRCKQMGYRTDVSV